MTKPIADSSTPVPTPLAADLPSRLPYSLFRPLLQGPNPVFNYEFKRLRWPKTFRQLDENNGRASLFAFFAYISLYVVMAVGNYSIFHLTWENSAVLFSVGLGLILALVADLYYSLLAVNIFITRLVSDQWDLMRLSTLRSDDILNAYYALLQIQAWRFVKIERAFRLIGWILFAFGLMIPVGILAFAYSFAVPEIALPLLGLASAIIWAYVQEPLWRMPTVVALGLAIAAQLRNPTFSTLGAVAAIFTLRLGQIAGVMIMFAVFGSVANHLHKFFFGGLVALIALGLNPFIRSTYTLLQRWFLKRAAYFAFRSE